MSSTETALIEENQRLKEERTHLKEQNQELISVLERRDATIRAQQQRIKEYIRRIYGRSSEKIDPSQMVFDDVILAAEKCLRPGEPCPHPDIAEEKVREHLRRKHPGRKPLPPELERIEHYLDIPEEEKVTADGKERPLIGLDITERLDYRPCVMVVNRYIRPKYGADDDIEGPGVKQHPPAEGPIDKCSAESGLLAHIITEKYEHHMPLYRQELKFARLGIDIGRQTMAGWLAGCAKALKPLYERMREEILSYDIVLNDDTPVEMLEPGSGQTKTTRLWCTVGAEDLKYTMYNYTLGRGREGPLEFFKGYKGYFVSDAYGGYDELLKSKDIQHGGCWAHARRYFVKAQDTAPKAATEVLTLIARLYRIEQKLKRADPKERLKVRQKESVPVLQRIKAWLKDNLEKHLPQSPTRKAMEYTLSIWKALNVYVTDGRLPIDNNLAENGIRPVALGRKNWLFVGSENGGHTAAILMTFTATCRKLKINTWEYLKDVLQRINTHPMSKINDLLPDRWQELRRKTNSS
jgi:transposase